MTGWFTEQGGKKTHILYLTAVKKNKKKTMGVKTPDDQSFETEVLHHGPLHTHPGAPKHR